MAESEPCPFCRGGVDSDASKCPDCHFPLAMLRDVSEKLPHIAASRPWASCDSPSDAPPSNTPGSDSAVCTWAPISRVGKAKATLQPGQWLIIGSRKHDPLSDISRLVVPHQQIAPEHVVILCDNDERAWSVLIDATASLPRVNGKPSNVIQLPDRAVLQIGPFGWEYDSQPRTLRPITPIQGYQVTVDAFVPGRLLPTKVHIKPHEMVAITGPSGCGKSTLIDEIRAGNRLDSTQSTAPEIYFMHQRDLLHGDLRIKDELEFVAKFYGQEEVFPQDIDDALQSVGLTSQHADRFPHQLSGGQLRRCRIAAAILSGRGIIILDEPDSGLDHETATDVIRMLRSVSLRGATVIAVTHHRHVLDLFDRVIEMEATSEGGQIVSDSATDVQRVPSEAPDADLQTESIAKGHLNATRQIPLLIDRERKKFISQKAILFPERRFKVSIPTCLLALVVVPLFFAALISISVPTDPNRNIADGIYGDAKWIHRLGFLAVVSVVWMAASQSHLAFARQRELYDHEQSLGVSWACLLAGKAVVNTMVAIVQASIFLLLLYLLRSLWLDRSFFVTEEWSRMLWIWCCLVAVATASTALGLLVSIIANRNPLTAAALIPVLMMVQILFSVSFAVADPHRTDPMDGYRQLTWNSDDVESDQQAKLPLSATSRISYFTLTRYGDQWLRSFAASVQPVDKQRDWQRTAIIGLSLWTLIYYLIAILFLYSETLGKKLHSRLSLSPTIRKASSAVGVILGTGASLASVSIVLVAMTFCLLMPVVVSAQPPHAAAESEHWKEISLPLVDGQYDSNALRRSLGAHAPVTPQWRRLDGKDVLALTALQLAGQAEFSVQGDTLELRLAPFGFSSVMSQLAPCRLDIPEKLNDSAKAVLFIHGLEGGASTFSQARQQCADRGIIAITFDYPNDGPPEFAADKLTDQLRALSRQHPQLRIVIVAHSLGGLIATWALGDPHFPVALVTDVFTLGTPFQGSALADFQSELELIDVVWRLVEKDALSIDLIHDGQGEAAQAITPGSDFLKQLRTRRSPANVRFHLGAGSQSFLRDDERSQLLKNVPAELARLKVSANYASKLERLLRSTEVTDELGDGAVTLESATAWKPRHCTRIFKKTHLGLVRSGTPGASGQVFSWVMDEMGW